VSHAEDNEGTRRDFLFYATAGAGAVAAGAAIWPLVNQMNPSADVQAMSSIRVDVSGVETGTQITIKFLGKPVFIRRRTEKEIEEGRAVELSALVDQNAENSNLSGDAPATGPEPYSGRGRRMAGHDGGLYPPGLRAAGQQLGRLRRLVLPLPRVAL